MTYISQENLYGHSIFSIEEISEEELEKQLYNQNYISLDEEFIDEIDHNCIIM